ncbi:ATP-binding protein [Paramaledivibacter caminithermalis]|jgi:two-component system sensor histidine kinase YcbA|uniref:histidine kinase n=1 Tax=Paramaledivibacter caminithermalis (strain DSM 15212 / CIP 107654 / DViRD3) TaxID=1121301 RepID=A0A1M6TMU8_PARC5|nr:ATP-binding protein [Paramaledivibacter caminithermalis]SHK58281.1 two-component system, sensor histidine kinase YcbA [Paramaledivibacter caminithermalis DSM 15212]
MQQLKRMFFVAIIVSIGAQFYLNFFVEGFIITFSVILLPLLLYKNHSLNPILTCIITGIASPLLRIFVIFISIRDFKESIYLVSPDVAFYFTYGFVFYYLYTSYDNKNLTRFAITVLSSDFLSNLVEISVRTHIVGLEGKIVKGLFIIALVRCVIVISIIITFKRYRSFLKTQEHEARYRRLMLLTSIFESETYFMNKNMKYIEDIMKKTFKAYRLSTEKDIPKEFQDIILDLSKDIHEIKKDYIRVIKGLEQIFTNKLKIEKMSIKDMVNILAINTNEYIENEDWNIEFKYKVKCDVFVKDHYYLMSILRNLINNGIEACKDVSNPNINLIIEDEDEKIKIYISDNGVGIKEDHMDYIFNPGFSTKFDKETGDISRGVGLTLVNNLVSDHFDGKIEVKSNLGKGTTFIITIDRDNIEGE